MNIEKAKQLFFAQYFGQKILRVSETAIANQPVDGYFIREFSDTGWLLLRSIEQLTDEEKVVIAGRMQIYPEDVLDWINGDCGHGDYENLHTWLPCYDILKAYGILLPFTYLNEDNKPITLSPDELISKGWVKYQTS